MIRPIRPSDRAVFLALSRQFYDSPAVMHDIPDDYHRRTFDYLMTEPADAACWMLLPDSSTGPESPVVPVRFAGPDHLADPNRSGAPAPPDADGTPVGYALTAQTWSREAGGPVVWLEELFIQPEWRRGGMGRRFFADWLGGLRMQASPPVRIRLEVEAENEGAIRLYRRMGFEPMAYRNWSLEWPR